MFDKITELILSGIVENAIGSLAKKLDSLSEKGIKVDTSDSKDAITDHTRALSNWASEISFKDLQKSKELRAGFVELDLSLGRFRSRRRYIRNSTSVVDNFPIFIKSDPVLYEKFIAKGGSFDASYSLSTEKEYYKDRGRLKFLQTGFKNQELSEHILVKDLVNFNKSVVILGDPGAGKTTSLKRVALAFLTNEVKANKNKTPLLIRLRDMDQNENSLSKEILGILGAKVKYEDEFSKAYKEKFEMRLVTQMLSNINCLLLLDGIDEITVSKRQNVIKQLRELMLHSKDYFVIATCRTADFMYSFENTTVFVIEPLSDKQIRDFAVKWLGQNKGGDLVKRIRNTPYGGSEVLPLNLAHLCAIYERTGSIPEKPRTTYRKIVRLCLEEWDEQRSVIRTSRYSYFDIDRKEDFLKAISYSLTIRLRSGSFSHDDLEEAYLEVYEKFGLPKGEAKNVAREIESHTGLILEIGLDNYEFAHKSLQEYLCAEYILKLPKIPVDICTLLPNEMALVVALSSDANGYFREVVHVAIDVDKKPINAFVFPFLRRLILEKVDFQHSHDLGKAAISLYSETNYPTKGQLQLPFDFELDVLNELVIFFQLPEIQTSVSQILETSTVEDLSWGNKRVIKLKEASNTSTQSKEYIIDKKFFELFPEKKLKTKAPIKTSKNKTFPKTRRK